jgi:hypothetical protein
MPTFADYQSEVLPPGWLQSPFGRAWGLAFGRSKDALVMLAKQAVKSRMPRLCAPDALAELARERGIERGPAETLESFRERVATAWDVWRWAGTPFGLLLAFWHAGYRPASGKVVLQTQGGGKQYELRADFDPTAHAPEQALVISDLATPVHLGGTPDELWSDFAVLFVSPLPPPWVPSPPADGSEEVEGIRRLILRWKSAHARCVALEVTSVDLWDYPQETWEPTSEVWNESGITTSWTPPLG